ncbi:type VI secretion system Vgr family protein [Cypionkella sp.]|uniref:type VI secretion system Vgr family protein n=1 Tax=Cypionkella sp. TaxID=2811411 RepID=UPI002723B74F|nr:type VI secretion system tip protein TssI/VgrG [Cypionkella sp.]MDO8984622.1 type VI secretion system tip protein TssI/VgrG [Cypionkella sp.]MDP2051130.1 type VI secretion system tip protein TssI/VgrG [Cypionkella sp.]
MPTTFSQDNRIGRMFTPLPANDLVLVEFSGSEAVNAISQFRVKALSAKPISEIEPLLGEAIAIEVVTPLGNVRDFHQMVDAIRYLGPEGLNHIYEFELRPWFWQLSRRINYRIFHEQNVIDVIRKIVDEYGNSEVAGFIDLTDGSFPEMEYVVQYGESDMEFLCRLMERFGINYHFQMEKTRHTLVLTTGADAFSDAPAAPRAFSPLGNRGDATPEHFEAWSPHRQLTTGSVRLVDYNFKTPAMNLEVSREDLRGFVGANLESFGYPGGYLKPAEGTPLAQRQLDGHRGGMASVRAQGNAASLGAGMKFPLSAHSDEGQLDEYAVLAAQHFVSNGSFRSGSTASDTAYQGSYMLTRSANPIAPQRLTRPPRVLGPQTAVVVTGAEGDIDEFGRIKVKFFWAPDDVSMYCRVSQIWGQDEWGTIFIPHVDMEVIVEFLDGDPDRPLVTGCVWNQKNRPQMPDNHLTSGFKTVRNNQLFFYDTEGKEEIYIRAQRDMTRDVMHDDKSTTHGKQTLKIDASKSESVGGSSSSSVGGDMSTSVSGAETHKVKGSLSIESKEKIELKVGSSSITIDQTSIKIKALTVEVEATAELKTKAGAMATHDGGAMMVIKGVLVTIN